MGLLGGFISNSASFDHLVGAGEAKSEFRGGPPRSWRINSSRALSGISGFSSCCSGLPWPSWWPSRGNISEGCHIARGFLMFGDAAALPSTRNACIDGSASEPPQGTIT